MILLSQYLRYKGYILTGCSLPYEGGFVEENSKSQKKYFSQRGSQILQINHEIAILKQYDT